MEAWYFPDNSSFEDFVGVALDHNLHFHLIFGKFVQTFEVSNNTMEPRTVDAFGLGTTGNLQGGLRFLAWCLKKYWIDVGRMKKC